MAKHNNRNKKKRKSPKRTGPQCPKCNRRAPNNEGDTFWCDHCSMMFDNDPDEGGDFCTDPTRRMMREEAR